MAAPPVDEYADAQACSSETPDERPCPPATPPQQSIAGLAATGLLSATPAVVAEYVLGRQRAMMAWTISPLGRRQVFYAGLMTGLDAAKEVRLFGLGGFLRRRLLADVRDANEGERSVDRRELGLQTWLGAVSAVTAGVGLIWVVAGAGGGRLSVGDVAVFVAAVAGVQSSLTTLVNLFLPAGAVVVLVGLNGSGKSTLVKLLCRFYDPQRGAILWDGVDIRELDPASLRQRMAAVFQDYVAYDFTAAENIGIGDLSLLTDQERIRAAAELAGIHRTLAKLPQGYDTMLSRTFGTVDGDDAPAGVLLSGGQWQRVALARAYLRQDRDFVILDEPSAGIDAQAEHEMHADLRRYRAGRTSLLISHRLNTVREADLIVVLADGRSVEQGTHAELMAAQGEYAHLFALQAEGYQPEVAPHPSG